MKKIIGNVLVIIYVIIAVFVTICLLSYNQYKITEFGKSSLIIIEDNNLEPEFKNGDLVIVNRKDKIKVGEEAFFYNTYSKEMEVTLGKIIGEEKISETEKTYTLEGNMPISSQYVIGPASTANKISVVGGILGILESKWGFLFIIVFPSLLAFIYELGVVISELVQAKKENKEDIKEDKEDNKENNKEEKVIHE